jgi:tRNA 5-methylaminomethyl-2-thiouridine biosynthesis bifunctional protein
MEEILRPSRRPRRVIVVGAGIAGVTTAYLLARRGHDVALFDREERAADGASGNPAGVVMPFLSHPEDPVFRYYDVAFRMASAWYGALEEEGAASWFRRTGAADVRPNVPKHRERLASSPHTEYWNAAEVAERTGAAAGGGAFFREAGILYPARYCEALLKSAAFSARGAFYPGRRAMRLWRDGGRRRLAFDHAGREVEETADAVVLCAAWETGVLLPDARIPFLPIKGQLSFLPGLSPSAPFPLCYGGYALPFGDGTLLGATFEKGRTDKEATREANAENLRRYGECVPSFEAGAHLAFARGRSSVRCALPDRRPVVGPVPGMEGCFLNAGHGSRGLTGHVLAGYLSAVYVEGEKVPEGMRNAAMTVNPLRFKDKR